MKGSLIAKIISWFVKRLRDSQDSFVKKSHERLLDNQSLIVRKESLWKGLRDSQRLRESLNPTVKGIPTERPETTTSCGLNPTVKGIPTERPETTISCGLPPIVRGCNTKSSKKSEDRDKHMFLLKTFYARKNAKWKSWIVFAMAYLPTRGQGAIDSRSEYS
jgi:hypothetical protein